MPVKEINGTGHCEKLKSWFKITDPLSLHLHDIALANYSPKSMNLPLNNDIEKIEIIENYSQDYSLTKLGKLEAFLMNEMPAKKIDF